jgi:hypothetical protein
VHAVISYNRHLLQENPHITVTSDNQIVIVVEELAYSSVPQNIVTFDSYLYKDFRVSYTSKLPISFYYIKEQTNDR